MGKTPEGRVLAEVMAFLQRVPGVRVSRNHSGMTRAYMRYGLFVPGGADIIGWRTAHALGWTDDPDAAVAVFLAIEVKQVGEGPSIEQARFLNEVKAAGGIAGVVHSVEECAALLRVRLA